MLHKRNKKQLSLFTHSTWKMKIYLWSSKLFYVLENYLKIKKKIHVHVFTQCHQLFIFYSLTIRTAMQVFVLELQVQIEKEEGEGKTTIFRFVFNKLQVKAHNLLWNCVSSLLFMIICFFKQLIDLMDGWINEWLHLLLHFFNLQIKFHTQIVNQENPFNSTVKRY